MIDGYDTPQFSGGKIPGAARWLRGSLGRMAALALAACLFAALPARAGEAQRLRFSLGLLRLAEKGAVVSEPLSRKLALPQGASFRLYYQPLTSQYLYLFLDDASQTLRLLHPGSLQDVSAHPPGTARLFPGPDSWYTLDATPGVETFLLMVSDTRLSKLEALAAALPGAGGKGAARDAVLAEITALKRSRSDVASPAEKPVPIAGTMRAASPSAKMEALEVDAERFYSRTLRIEHP